MTLLITIHALCCLMLIAVILIQPGKGDMGATFGSSSQSVFGSKGAGNFLTKTTSICAGLFLLTSFILTKIKLDQEEKSVVTPQTLEKKSDDKKPEEKK